MAKKLNIPRDNNIIKVPIEEAMPDNYLPYAVEVAKDRALPDVRDGLKPVHRRIIYGAYMLRAFPDKPYYKSARIVGDILGKYHPHGDTSVYDAMVILAQNFSTRKPLIDGHGNWGSIDGDNAAAMRYTEARLTPIALEMIKDIEKGVVDMVDNYSASEKEPVVLPAKYPNLLVNGTFGIAVGLATNIPPHNLSEVIDACLAYIENNDITTSELMEFVKAPDLPTGGILIGRNSLLAAYETGEGKVSLRAKTSIERLENGRVGIVITEFPYRRNKAKLLQLISEMTGDKRHAKALEAVTDIRDESDRNGIRAVIELKKAADEELADKVLKYLFKKTDLQCNINFNMVAIADGKPQTLGLKSILKYYVNHQKEVVTRRTVRELQTAEKRFHIVEGFIKAIGIMDDIIKTIRASKSKKDAENNLMSSFGFSEMQAEAIVELMLYKLTGLEVKTFEKEYKELEKEIKRLRKILSSEYELFKVIKAELTEVKEKYGDERKTAIVENDEEAKIDLEELVVIEDTMVTLSNEGFIKRVPLKSYARSNTNIEDIDYREGDFNKFLFQSNTKDIIMMFTDNGNMYQLKGNAVPECRWKDKGERVDEIIRGMNLNDEKIISVFSVGSQVLQKDFIFFTDKGIMKKTNFDKFITNYTKIMAVKMKNDEKLLEVQLVDNCREEGFIKIITKEGLEFSLEEPKLLATERGVMGTQLFNLPKNDRIINIEAVAEFEYKTFIVIVDKKGNIKSFDTGKNVYKEKVRCFTNSQSKLLIFLSDGNVIQLPAYLVQNTSEKGVNIANFMDNIIDKCKVVNIVSVVNFEQESNLYFFSKKGLVKKTMLKEFNGEYMSTLGYKLKSDSDELIAVDMCEEEKDILLVTKKAMMIRFNGDSINFMGKAASGVTGISLKEDDEVLFAKTIKRDSGPSGNELAVSKLEKELTITTKTNIKKNILVDDIKLQNRAGRGSSALLVVMDDEVVEIKIK